MAKEKKPEEASQLFENIMKASFKGNPKSKEKKADNMNVSNQKELDELRNKYKGHTATHKETKEQYLIEDINLNTYRGLKEDTLFAIALLAPLDSSYKDMTNPPPSLDFVLKYYSISE